VKDRGFRNAWLQNADAEIRSGLEQQRKKAMETIGDNIPQPQVSNE